MWSIVKIVKIITIESKHSFDSFLSTSTHDIRNSVVVQAEVYVANSPVLYRNTSENTSIADMEQNRLLQAQ